jgi:hypothetical protein
MRGFFDFETYEWTNALCCGLVWDGGKSEDFIHDTTHKNPDAVVDSALRAMYETECPEWWAHNMGKFDGLFLSSAAMRLGWRQSAILAGGNRVIGLELTPPKSKRKITICDTFALAPAALAKLAEDFDLPSRKLFTKDDYSIDTRKWDVSRLRAGCLVDCRLGLELLDKLETLVEDWGGKLKKTFSSTALGIVRANLEQQGKKLPNHFDSPDINPIARLGYYGARVEVIHHKPDHWLTEYDVNSSYPAAMAEPVPWKFVGIVHGKGAEQRFHNEEMMMVQAQVSVPPQDLPPLPYKPKPDAGIFFPSGEWEAWFPAPELAYAIEKCGVKAKIVKGLVYEKEQPFEEFISSVYKLKSETIGAKRTFTKFLLNGCYGKFGEKPEHTSLECFGTDAEGFDFQQENHGRCTPLGEGCRMLAVSSERWAMHAHFAIAAYITGRARIALHRFLLASDSPAYCDSDSIHCKESKSAEINRFVSNELGALKVEIQKYKGEFYAPKIYRLTEENGKQHLACKGFPVNGEAFGKVIDSAAVKHDALKRYSTLSKFKIDTKGKIGVETHRMRLLKSQLRAGGTSVARINQVKTWAGLSMKRKPFSDGSTEAWTVSELQSEKHKDAICPLLVK